LINNKLIEKDIFNQKLILNKIKLNKLKAFIKYFNLIHNYRE